MDPNGDRERPATPRGSTRALSRAFSRRIRAWLGLPILGLPVLGLPVLGLSILAVPTAAAAEVKLGVAGPMSGPNAVFGDQLRDGVALAVADINRTGGILGQKIELVVGDDLSDPRRGVVVANTLANGGVSFVVGHFNSAVSIAASLVYLERGMLMVTPSAISPQVTDKGRWNVFRTSGRDDTQAEVAGRIILSRLKGRRIAFVHDRTTYGRELADATRRYINANGMAEVLADAIDADDKNTAPLIERLKAAAPDVLFWGGGQRDAGLLIRRLHEAGLQTTLMGGDAIVGDDLVATAGAAVVGTLMTYPPDDLRRPEAAAMIRDLRAQGRPPATYSLSSVAAVQVLAQAAEKAGSLDPQRMAAVMHSGILFHTAVGDLAFDRKGDLTRPSFVLYAWMRNANGQLKYVQQTP